jgi:hypothetical protein
MPLGAARFGLLGGVADLGKLELIETQTVSSAVAQVDFTSIDESIYNVHFLTFNGLELATNDSSMGARLSNDGGSTFETANYQYAVQYYFTSGSFGEIKGTSISSFRRFAWGDSGDVVNGYCYFYNLGDSSKYSFLTHQCPTNIETSSGTGFGYFGSQVYAVAETINAIRLFNHNTGGNFQTQGTISLYGIAES